MPTLNRVYLGIQSKHIMAETILKHALKTAGILIAFALAYTLLLAYTHDVTKEPIEKSEAEVRMALFSQILPDNMHNNAMLKDTINIAPNELLGNTQPTVANRARIDNKPSAIILEALAHDGYAGDIKLLIAIKYDGSLAGVRVITHKETPGLGDYIDIAKGNWIKLFDGESLQKTSDAQNDRKWAVKKDGGQFDYMAGATITPRAVVKAVHKALQYYEANKEVLFS
jgi:Na+-translocating ferredoxin:NAD+ oxidoreductase subunit G